jgi:predicted transcriptional regulator
VEAIPNPKPHQNTVATILKILVEKEFVAVEVMGRLHLYYPLVLKEEYTKRSMKQLVKGYFEGSFNNVVSFLVKENNISIEELETLLKQNQKSEMKQFLLYFIQVIISSGILYGFYHFVLRNTLFHKYNRYYLLASVLLSVFVPFQYSDIFFRQQSHNNT